MVFFTCDACGESLKKGAVEKHYQFQCRNCSVLSCVDCGKDFHGDAYKEHIKCVSEEEKYSGKNYKPKPGANKGEVKQELWTNQVQAAINKCKADPKLKNVLERLKDYPNIPRKKVKFENFIKNSLGIRDPSTASRTWDLIAAEMPPSTPAPTPNHVVQNNNNNEKPKEVPAVTPDNVENGDSSEKKLSKRDRKEERKKQQNKGEKKDKSKKRKNDTEELENHDEPKKKKKRKHEEQENEAEELHVTKKSKNKHKKKQDPEEEEPEEDNNEEEEESAPVEKFSWEAAIIGCLKKADGKELSLKKLRKKVIGEYAARGGDAKVKSEAELLSKFNKKYGDFLAKYGRIGASGIEKAKDEKTSVEQVALHTPGLVGSQDAIQTEEKNDIGTEENVDLVILDHTEYNDVKSFTGQQLRRNKRTTKDVRSNRPNIPEHGRRSFTPSQNIATDQILHKNRNSHDITESSTQMNNIILEEILVKQTEIDEMLRKLSENVDKILDHLQLNTSKGDVIMNTEPTISSCARVGDSSESHPLTLHQLKSGLQDIINGMDKEQWMRVIQEIKAEGAGFTIYERRAMKVFQELSDQDETELFEFIVKSMPQIPAFFAQSKLLSLLVSKLVERQIIPITPEMDDIRGGKDLDDSSKGLMVGRCKSEEGESVEAKHTEELEAGAK